MTQTRHSLCSRSSLVLVHILRFRRRRSGKAKKKDSGAGCLLLVSGAGRKMINHTATSRSNSVGCLCTLYLEKSNCRVCSCAGNIAQVSYYGGVIIVQCCRLDSNTSDTGVGPWVIWSWQYDHILVHIFHFFDAICCPHTLHTLYNQHQIAQALSSEVANERKKSIRCTSLTPSNSRSGWMHGELIHSGLSASPAPVSRHLHSASICVMFPPPPSPKIKCLGERGGIRF